jgi:MacB-like periplasmic core domain
VLTLALGIGANTAVFSVVNVVLLNPLPFREPDRLAQIWKSGPRSGGQGDWASFPGLDQPGHNHVTVLGHGLWTRRFGGDPAVLGRSITIDGRSYVVIGVMAARFRFPYSMPNVFELHLPMQAIPDQRERGSHNYWAIGRLRPGVSFEQARIRFIGHALRPAGQAVARSPFEPEARVVLGVTDDDHEGTTASAQQVRSTRSASAGWPKASSLMRRTADTSSGLSGRTVITPTGSGVDDRQACEAFLPAGELTEGLHLVGAPALDHERDLDRRLAERFEQLAVARPVVDPDVPLGAVERFG